MTSGFHIMLFRIKIQSILVMNAYSTFDESSLQNKRNFCKWKVDMYSAALYSRSLRWSTTITGRVSIEATVNERT